VVAVEDLLDQWEILDLEERWGWDQTAPWGLMGQWDQMDPTVQLVLSLPPTPLHVVILVLDLTLDLVVHLLAQLQPLRPLEAHLAPQVPHQTTIPPVLLPPTLKHCPLARPAKEPALPAADRRQRPALRVRLPRAQSASQVPKSLMNT